MSRYLYLESIMCKELDKLEEKYKSGAEMSEGDLRRIDLLSHSLNSLDCYVAKKEAEDAQRMAYENSVSPYAQNTRYVDANRQYVPYVQTDRRW